MARPFRIRGVKKVMANMDKTAKKIDSKTEKAITDVANDILKDAMIDCPVETGQLRRSGTVENPKTNRASITVEIGFHTKYALYVHEDQNAHHTTGKAKFLEDNVNAALPTLANKIKSNMGRF